MKISEMILKLSSQADKHDKDYAIQLLYQNLGDVKKLVMPQEGRSCWKTAAYLLKIIGKPYIDPAIEDMFCWLRDKSYPGSDIIFRTLLESLPKLNLAEYLEITANKAISQGDSQWLSNLAELASSAGLQESDFNKKSIYTYLKISMITPLNLTYVPDNEYDLCLKRQIISGELSEYYNIYWKKLKRTLRY